MRLVERHDIVRASFVPVRILLLALMGGCAANFPIASDVGGGSPGTGGMGGSGGTGGMSGTGSTATAGGTAMGGAGGAGGTGGTAATGGTGGALACQPSTVVPCYLGPPGTEGVGRCTAGTQTCNPDGMAYGPCIGQILPGPEICGTAMQDENCDGHPDCECGDGTLDPGESCDDGNTMDGDTCPATCVRPIVKVAVGYEHSCALLDDASVKCWGSNGYGQIGLGDTLNRGDQPNEMGDNLPAVDLGTGKTAVDIAAGFIHTCALLGDGSVKCWGANHNGRLGLGDALDRGDQPNEMGDNLPAIDLGTGISAVSISVGFAHSCALLNDGRVKCWGFNGRGELGLGDTIQRGDQPGEMGDSLPAVDLGTGKTASQISVGEQRSCAILDDGSLKCWGSNGTGGLGLGDTLHRGDQPNEMGDNLPAVDLGTGKSAVQIAYGFPRCAILNDGSLKCWGSNQSGALGLGDTSNRGDGPNEMGDNLPVVELGTGETAIAVIGMSGGSTCALLQSGHVKCWGYNTQGQLGLGDNLHRGDGPLEMGDYLPAVDLGTAVMPSAISGRNGRTCAIVNAGRMKCWGINHSGELGLGDTLYRGDNPGEMGDNLPFVGL